MIARYNSMYHIHILSCWYVVRCRTELSDFRLSAWTAIGYSSIFVASRESSQTSLFCEPPPFSLSLPLWRSPPFLPRLHAHTFTLTHTRWLKPSLSLPLLHSLSPSSRSLGCTTNTFSRSVCLSFWWRTEEPDMCSPSTCYPRHKLYSRSASQLLPSSALLSFLYFTDFIYVLDMNPFNGPLPSKSWVRGEEKRRARSVRGGEIRPEENVRNGIGRRPGARLLVKKERNDKRKRGEREEWSIWNRDKIAGKGKEKMNLSNLR